MFVDKLYFVKARRKVKNNFYKHETMKENNFPPPSSNKQLSGRITTQGKGQRNPRLLSRAERGHQNKERIFPFIKLSVPRRQPRFLLANDFLAPLASSMNTNLHWVGVQSSLMHGSAALDLAAASAAYGGRRRYRKRFGRSVADEEYLDSAHIKLENDLDQIQSKIQSWDIHSF